MDAAPGTTADRLHAIGEIMAATVLSAAALLTAWASYQAALWDGEQAAAYTRAGAARVQAGLLATENGQAEAVDLFLFSQWLNAFAAHDDRLQAFYRARFRPEFAHAFAAWVALEPHRNPQAPPTPFAMQAYRPVLGGRARAMDARADALFEEGQHDNAVSDCFVQATVSLALALFMGGIGQTFRRASLRLALTGLAVAACIFGVVQLIALPTLSPP